MRKILFIVVIYSFMFFIGCGNRSQIKELSKDSVILAFGNSLTYGAGADFDESYPSVLADLAGYKVINAGVPGEETSEGLKRLTSVLEENHPDLAIICHGGNDMLGGRELKRVAGNIEAMVSMIKDRGIDVMLISVPKPGLWLRSPGFYRKIAAKYFIPIENDILGKLLSSPKFKSDQIHLNAKGYRKLAEQVAELIERRAKR